MMNLSKLLPLIGIFLFIFILLNIDISQVMTLLSDANPFYLLLALVMVFPIILTKTLKWKFIVRSYGIDFSVPHLMKSWLIGFSIGMITPARLGDISRAYYLRDKISFGRGMITVIVDRIIDVFTLFVLSITGIFNFLIFTEFFDLLTTVIVFFSLFLTVIYLSAKKRIVSLFF